MWLGRKVNVWRRRSAHSGGAPTNLPTWCWEEESTQPNPIKPPRRQPASSHITIQELTIGCCRLKATLSEALAAQDKTSQRPSLHTESPADMAIRLLDNLITGDEVRAGRRLAFMHPWGMGPSGNPLKGSRPIPQGGGRQALLVQHLCLNSYCRSVITHHAEVINVNAPPSCKAMNVRLLSLGRVPCSAKVSMYVLLS